MNTLNVAGSVVRDLALGGVIWVGIGSKKETLNNFFEELGEKKCSKINEWFKNVEKAGLSQFETGVKLFHIRCRLKPAVLERFLGKIFAGKNLHCKFFLFC
ncbi:MAG: hypothetical protein U9Q22_06155 [Candidatus Altiarchaeota archaeon]|nr:hypothetical protein [Candidatus Altiarchaeota archaeon]